MAGIVREQIKAFYNKYLSVGDRLGEAFYAVWMVVVSLGVLNSATESQYLVLYAIYVAFSVNIAWGVIDGLTVMHSNIIEKVENDKLVYNLRTRNDKGTRDEALNALGSTLVADLSAEEKEKIIDAVASGSPTENPYRKRFYPQHEDWYYALGIIAIDASFVIPLIFPLLLMGDSKQAIYVSRLIATTMFAILGAAYAKNLNRRRWLAALFLGTLAFSVFTAAYELGW